MNLDLRIK